MTGRGEEPVVVFSQYWRQRDRELSYIVRSIAGAASRGAPVTVLVPGSAAPEADGAFDLTSVGAGPDGGWPAPDELRLPAPIPAGTALIVDDLGAATPSLLPQVGLDHRLFGIAGSPDQFAHLGAHRLAIVGPGDENDPGFVGLHVPVNPLAARHRHNGFGFVGYILVLSDRTGPHDGPSDTVAWLTSSFHDANIVVIENATASVWRGRALRGATSVDSRTDLWRLIAHARVCVDVAPGPHLARECVEALRYGTPIIVPEHAPAAAAHAAAGGGLTYDSMADLLRCTTRFEDDAFRSGRSAAGKAHADASYGDPTRFTERVRRALTP